MKLQSLEEAGAKDGEPAGPGLTLQCLNEAGAKGEELVMEPEEEVKDEHEEDLEETAGAGAAPAPASIWGGIEHSLEEDSFKT